MARVLNASHSVGLADCRVCPNTNGFFLAEVWRSRHWYAELINSHALLKQMDGPVFRDRY